MKIKDILKTKGRQVWTVKANQTIQEAVHLLSYRGVGALLVTDDEGENVLGILSERDIVHGCNVTWRPLISVRVVDWMTRNLITCSSEDEVQDIMGVMTEHRVRHLPVVEHDEICGVISIGDVVKALLEDSGQQIQFLREYAFGSAAD